jgi:hypothetical protein
LFIRIVSPAVGGIFSIVCLGQFSLWIAGRKVRLADQKLSSPGVSEPHRLLECLESSNQV